MTYNNRPHTNRGFGRIYPFTCTMVEHRQYTQVPSTNPHPQTVDMSTRCTAKLWFGSKTLIYWSWILETIYWAWMDLLVVNPFRRSLSNWQFQGFLGVLEFQLRGFFKDPWGATWGVVPWSLTPKYLNHGLG